MISKKEQQQAIEKLKIPTIEFGFDKRFDNYVNDDNINDDAKSLINRLDKPKKISLSENRAFYDTSNLEISFRESADQNTFMHEYGHHVDVSNNYISQNKIFKNAYNKDFNFLKKEYGKIDEMIPKVLSNLQDENGNVKNEFKGASDILDSLTKGKVADDFYGEGHGKSYFKYEPARHIENFANIFEAWSKNDQTQIDVIKKYYPNLYKSFIDIIEKL